MATRPLFTRSKVLGPLTLAIILVVAICSSLYLREADQVKRNVLEREARRVDIYGDLFINDAADAVTDLRVLASGDGIQAYLASNRPDDLQRAVRRAVFFSNENPEYDQIRYIDADGNEVFRVNQHGVVVPASQLQNKADRGYFQKIAALPPGVVFVSNFDLNIENGTVEQPYKPMIRFGMPLFDQSGHRRGVYIINYLGRNMISRLEQFVPQYAPQLRILNAQGYWLKGAQPDQEWGFMFPDRAKVTMAQTNPGLWARVWSERDGQVPYGGGYFTWHRTDPSDIARGKPVVVVDDDSYLIIASEVSPQEWAAYFIGLRQTFVVVGVILLGLAIIICWIFQERLRIQWERDRFFDMTRDLLCVAGFDGSFKRLNPAWENALGYSKNELLAKPFLEFVHPDDQEKTIAESARLVHGGESVSFENRYRCKDGSYRWLLWSARSLVEEQLIFASARDQTERKQIEETLRQSEERTRLMIESVRDYAIFMLHPDGRVGTWNAAAERIQGYRAEEVIGQHHSLFYPEDAIRDQLPKAELEEAAEEGRVETEGWQLRKDGSRFWANVIINAVHRPDGELQGFVKVTRDVTTRREADESIRKLNDELKHRAELLEVANQELESFSYSVSHDLRAPLRHIHGFVDILQKSEAFDAHSGERRYMDIIGKAAREMGRLIDDLLAFSRTGRAEMRPAMVNMREIVDRIIRDYEIDNRDRKITWDIRAMPDAAADPALLRLVWVNLLDNALKYTRSRDEARIEVGQEISAHQNGNARELVYYVRDNGVGFDMQYASKLFGVFQRLHRAEDFEGTGIGLANVQRIIHRHGGRVWARGDVGVGATFYFALPILAPQRT